ncbi:MAG: NmrA family NAD(P)-binding protein [bacterium]|nr:NmrA family NAD(P)-binding protein [bacterium]
MPTTKPRFLVTTANGRTGSAAVNELLALGHPVRALVTRDDSRAATWRQKGAEVVVGNMFDRRDLRRALRDVQRVYHCPPFDARHLHGAMLLALTAEEAGVEVIALMSGWNPHPTHPSVMQREHWMANNLYRRLPVDVIHINPGMFAFTYLVGLPAVKHFGVLALPFGEGLSAPPSNEDIGAVAAHALMNPERYVGRCLRPTGPKLVDSGEVANVLSQVLERSVRYRAIPEATFVKFALAQGFPLFQVAQVRHFAAEMRAGAFGQPPSDHVREVTGRDPEDIETFVRRYVGEPSQVMPGLRLGSYLNAIGLGMRAMLTRVPDLDAWEDSRDYPRIHAGELAHDNPDWMAAADRGSLLLQPDSRETGASGSGERSVGSEMG